MIEDQILNKLRKEVNKYALPSLAAAADVPYVTLYRFATGRTPKPRKRLREALVRYFDAARVKL